MHSTRGNPRRGGAAQFARTLPLHRRTGGALSGADDRGRGNGARYRQCGSREIGRGADLGVARLQPGGDRARVERNLVPLPGVFTPTEAFSRCAPGARHLKLFPAEAASPKTVKAWKAVLPRDVKSMRWAV